MKLTLPDAVILNTATESAIMNMTRDAYKFLRNLTIVAPVTLPETVKVYVAKSITGVFAPLQSGGADISLTAGKALVLTSISFGAMKLVATSGAVVGDRTFEMSGAEEFAPVS